MSAPFIGEIRMFPYSFAPRGWAFCAGQLLSISQNTALFSIIGTLYGGDGRTTMGLPDLRGRAPLGHSPDPHQGLSHNHLGGLYGDEAIYLTRTQMPAHTHITHAYNKPGTTSHPSNQVMPARDVSPDRFYISKDDMQNPAPMSEYALSEAGNSHPHENRQPYLTTQFCICMFGEYPRRN
ncbi:MAG: tail fiber protein [Pseudomonadota bacterium]|nr:tail fiber protein [Pseudomonadota bacterium]MEC8482481.1 tail fiber protein [Pseudomonadota bacterium]